MPSEPELVTFDTPFGKFGIFICFDLLFYNPAVALVVEHNVDTILFPTAWMNLLPHLTAVEFHSAWAMGMGVNLLSANTHNTSMRMTGKQHYVFHLGLIHTLLFLECEQKQVKNVHHAFCAFTALQTLAAAE